MPVAPGVASADCALAKSHRAAARPAVGIPATAIHTPPPGWRLSGVVGPDVEQRRTYRLQPT